MKMMRLIPCGLLLLFTLFWLSTHIGGQASAESEDCSVQVQKILCDQLDECDENKVKEAMNGFQQKCGGRAGGTRLDGSMAPPFLQCAAQKKNECDAGNRLGSFVNAPN
jgi:hypothetical protein